MLGQEEAEEIIDSEGSIEVACEFCNEHYHFDRVDVTELFTNTVSTEGDPDTLH